jgi:hypothetical protein
MTDDELLCELFSGISLYEALKWAGVSLDHHESDLYVESTPTARALLSLYVRNGWLASKGEPFVSRIDGKFWIDVPFMYEPFWIAKETLRSLRAMYP